jgi:hypothetical protein
MLKRTGAWIFVSHSLRDFPKVRLVRNALEEQGHFPLLFYLRCLHDETEVDDLIRREIEARSFFLLCDSADAKNSTWVQKEVDIIQSRPRRLIERLDLDSNWSEQLEVINRISSRINVFVSYSRVADLALATSLREQLEAADYGLLGDTDRIDTGDDVVGRIQCDIDEAIRSGFVVVLLSPESTRSAFQRYETWYALERLKAMDTRNPRVIPVVVRDLAGTMSAMPAEFRSMHTLDVSMLTPEAQVHTIVKALDGLVSG